jgi:hypothetical protein
MKEFKMAKTTKSKQTKSVAKVQATPEEEIPKIKPEIKKPFSKSLYFKEPFYYPKLKRSYQAGVYRCTDEKEFEFIKAKALEVDGKRLSLDIK